MKFAPPDMLCFALYSATNAMQFAYGPLLATLGLTYPQFLALSGLATTGDQTVGRLGHMLGLESNTLTPMLKRMEKAGWVKRLRDTGDDRQVRVTLTDAGRDLASRATDTYARFAQKTSFDPTSVTDLRDVLFTLRDRLKPR